MMCEGNSFVESCPEGVFLPLLHPRSHEDIFRVEIQWGNRGLFHDEGLGMGKEAESRDGIRSAV